MALHRKVETKMFMIARTMFRFFAFISATCFFSAVSIADDIQCRGIGGPTNQAYSLSPTEINGPIQKQKLFKGKINQYWN